MKENRNYKRITKKIKLSISDENLFNYDDMSVSKDVSDSGISLTSPVSIGVGKIRTCKISFPETDKSIETVIKVVWEKEDNGEFLIGLKFLDINNDQQNLIQDHLLD